MKTLNITIPDAAYNLLTESAQVCEKNISGIAEDLIIKKSFDVMQEYVDFVSFIGDEDYNAVADARFLDDVLQFACNNYASSDLEEHRTALDFAYKAYLKCRNC